MVMEQQSNLELTDRLVDLIVYLNRELHIGSLDEWRALGMTIPQIKSLVVLRHKGPMRMGEIANFLGNTLSATTSIIDRLVERRLIERGADPSDRRVVVCKIDRGRRIENRRIVAHWP
ncbi:MAG: MarR family transcriptional regulator [Chloroflexi bacterium]|nr:MarR family transcriptional regulator [Chloroflexota bacterium]